MKILFLSNRGLLPIKDGHTRRSFNILKGLAERNEVHYLSMYESPDELSAEHMMVMKNICAQVEFVPAPSKRLGIPMAARLLGSLFSADPYTVWRHYSKTYQDRIAHYLETGVYDLVHCDTLPIGYTVRDRSGVFKSITDHDVSYLKCLRIAQACVNPALKAFLYIEAYKLKRLESKILRQFDLGIAVSDLDRQNLAKLCPEARLVVIENGVETDRFTPYSGEPDSNRLLWVGGFDHYPNREGMTFFLKKVYPRIKARVKGATLDVIGGGKVGRLKAAGGDSSVRMLGYVDDPLGYMHRSSVFIVPILTGGGTRLKVLEAMSAGKAIVSTTIGCEGIGAKDGVHYMLADDPEIFAQKVVTAIKDASLRRSLGSNARRFVEKHYDYRRICGKLNEIYQNEIRINAANAEPRSFGNVANARSAG